VLLPSFVRSFVHSFIYLFACSFVCLSFVHPIGTNGLKAAVKDHGRAESHGLPTFVHPGLLKCIQSFCQRQLQTCPSTWPCHRPCHLSLSLVPVTRYPDGHLQRIIGPINDMRAESETVLEHTGITWQVCVCVRMCLCMRMCLCVCVTYRLQEKATQE